VLIDSVVIKIHSKNITYHREKPLADGSINKFIYLTE
jgi:hypothetical protein